ncbi:MAG: extracellular solute-binding protein [Acidimicrobiales bacterium]
MAPSKTPAAVGRRAGRLGASLASVAVLSVVLAACGGTGSADIITLYSGQHQQTTDQLVSAFEHATGITVQVRSGDEDTLADQIVTEGSRSPADVFFTENSPALEYLQEKGLLASVDSPTLERVPARFDSPTGRWVGISARVSVLIYNPSLIRAAQLPTTALGLADPRYRGELALAPGETDFQPIVTSMLRTYGRSAAVSWLRGIDANAGSHLYPDNETVTNEVNRGAVAFGVVNQYYWYRLRSEIGASEMHSRLAFFVQRDPGYVIDVSGAAVLRSSPHQAAAQRLLAFLVSPPGQQIIVSSDSFEYPIASGAPSPPGQPAMSQLQPAPVSVAQLGDGAPAIALLKTAGLL